MTVLSAGAVVLALAATSCTKETIVFRDRGVFNAPPDASTGFLGYFNPEDQVTTCGNCHAEKQALWENTAHARAFGDLEASGHAQATCYPCHTVTELGNIVDTTAGWNALQTGDSIVPVPEYYDVQCESCHGPGIDHVSDPNGVKPLSTVLADTSLTNGCGECHRGTHNPFVEQWEESAHGSGGSFARGTNTSCQPCHNGFAYIKSFKGETRFLGSDTLTTLNITCAVCHDPHGSPNDAQLRAPIDVASRDHLCVTCHSRNGTPPSSHGPHAAQGLMVLGTGLGWIPPGFTYDTTRIVGTHGSEANQKLCVTCHVYPFTVTDAATGDFTFQSVGHTFEAIPCLDQDSLPTAGPCGDAQRDFRACAASGCHGTPAAARSILGVVRGRLENLLDQLWDDTNGDDSINAGDGGLLPQVVAQGDTAELDVTDQVVSVAEGALWNAQLAFTSTRPQFGNGYAFGIHFSAHKASADGAHNPFVLEALLTASIQAVINTYGVTPSPGLDLRVHATPPPGLRMR